MRTLDIAKRIIDYGFYPPTVYFPLIVEECLMVEPTETEVKDTLDRHAAALHAIVRELRRLAEELVSADELGSLEHRVTIQLHRR